MSLKDDLMKFLHPYDVMEDEPEEFEEEPPRQERPERRSAAARPEEERRSKVVSLHNNAQLKMVVMKPVKFDEDARSIADNVLSKRTVVVNMETTDPDTARRVLDFVSGVAYASGGDVKLVAAKTYIVTPYSGSVEGDYVNELEKNDLF